MRTSDLSKYNSYNNYKFGEHKVVSLNRERSKFRNHIVIILIFFLSTISFMAFLRSPFFAVQEFHVARGGVAARAWLTTG